MPPVDFRSVEAMVGLAGVQDALLGVGIDAAALGGEVGHDVGSMVDVGNAWPERVVARRFSPVSLTHFAICSDRSCTVSSARCSAGSTRLFPSWSGHRDVVTHPVALLPKFRMQDDVHSTWGRDEAATFGIGSGDRCQRARGVLRPLWGSVSRRPGLAR